MDQTTNANPIDKEGGQSRPLKIAVLGVAFAVVCILFILAFILFEPDQLSLADQYFPPPTPTPARAASQWNILLSDSFDNNVNKWDTGVDNDDFADLARQIKNGKYQWKATSKKRFGTWVTAETEPVGDFLLTVEAQQITKFSSPEYGLVFREDTENNFYYFGIDHDSFHVLLLFNDEWTDVIQWTDSKAILPKGRNKLTVIARGSYFNFLINGQYVAEANDGTITNGTTGLAVQMRGGNQQATFEFDNFELREP